MEVIQIAFGDRVRIRPTEETKNLSIAGLHGIVQGRTTPSVTGVRVIGKSPTDIAFGVLLDGQATPFMVHRGPSRICGSRSRD